MPTFVRQFAIERGTLVDMAPETEEDLYVTPEEIQQLYGCSMSMQAIRAAMSLIAAHCNRASLWPCEYDTGPLEIPMDRQETRIPITPIVSVVDASGRYGMTRRDRQGWNMWQGAIATYLIVAGSKPTWSAIDVATLEWDANTGIVYVPPSWLLAPWAFLRFKVISGLVTIPERVKLAVFEITTNMAAKGVSDRTRYSVGRVSRTYSTDSFLTPTAKQLLAPYVVQALL